MATPGQPTSPPSKGSKSRNAPLAHDGEAKKSQPSKDKSSPSEAKPDPFATGYDFLIVNSPMDGDLFLSVVDAVSKNKLNKKAVVFLVSWGGLADAAYRTGRYLQSTYDSITIFIPSSCKSAGTLLAIAGKSLIMSPFGELGPFRCAVAKTG